eukprot:CAMPEP_0174981774 /NCGR_PEP_ID=MMETSP0004_2-20121128/16089_1 /TAXON_ID=420556 /ORGANISM="Ochromonas sp., Strain CCMP1393" /LENGTH=119 /DNA_ID=CAMNT_0016233581 /DNA_START=1 /DNA_END=360 /DNA_ORIENTATION=+
MSSAKELEEKLRYVACRENDLNEVKRLVATGVNVNAGDLGGYTALILAAMWGHTATVKYLVEQAGANVEAKDNVSTEGRKEGVAEAFHPRHVCLCICITLKCAGYGLQNHKSAYELVFD